MYKYKVQVKKVSGRLNESVLPSKNLIVKTKTKKSKSAVLAEASKFFKKKYGLVIESGDVDMYDDYVTDEQFVNTLKNTIRQNLTTAYVSYMEEEFDWGEAARVGLPMGMFIDEHDGNCEVFYSDNYLKINHIGEECVYRFSLDDVEVLSSAIETMKTELKEYVESGKIEIDEDDYENEMEELMEDEYNRLENKLTAFAQGSTELDPDGWSLGYCQSTRPLMSELLENIGKVTEHFMKDISN